MKTSKLIPFSVLLLVTMLACSTISNLGAQPTPTPNKVIFEETEFSDACQGESTPEVERLSENGQFIMNVVSPSYIGWTECTGSEFSDLILEVDATQVSGPNNNAYGVILRYGLEADAFYTFIISGDGYYAFTVDGVNYTDPEFLVEWTESSAIRQGAQTNRLKVVAVGSSLKYYVNDQFLGEVQDSRFTTGTVGFFTGSVEEGNVRIAFDNLRVSEP
ncbi:MAG: hypothetical protein HY865_15060 [Chloroflexi bacterium]|nr:hypothetical protein [Chloroflexota bacterium]